MAKKPKKQHRMKAETLGGHAVTSPAPAVPERPIIGDDYIARYVAMQSERQEQQGNGAWPVGLRAKMRDQCSGLTRKRDIKAVVAKLAGLKPEDV